MGDTTEFVKLQQAKWAPFSDTVKAAFGIIILNLGLIIDSCNTPSTVPTSAMQWLTPVGTILGAAWGVYARWKAEGPLVWSKPVSASTEASKVVDVPVDSTQTARVTVPPPENPK